MLSTLIPQPVSVTSKPGKFVLSSEREIWVNDPALLKTAEILQDSIMREMQLGLAVAEGSNHGQIELRIEDNQEEEAYSLSIKPHAILLSAGDPAGIFMGMQTLLQLFYQDPDGHWLAEACEIEDAPRYPWRGVMLDVARHFFPVEVVKRVIDLISLYKFNRLHLHLTDDQGWRIEIKQWPKLTTVGARTQVGGGEGGFYTQEDYLDLVAYAAERFIMVVPEIDLPGHTNAALASYPELHIEGEIPSLYTGTEVGFSTLQVNKPLTYQFIEEVLGEIAALTPGAYIHIGGDEAKSTDPADYAPFIHKVQEILNRLGKQMIGWQEIGRAYLKPGTFVQYWNVFEEFNPLPEGVGLIMSPGNYAYLDMKYNPDCPLGLSWAGMVNSEQSFSWDPADHYAVQQPERVIGLEAVLWSETLEAIADIEYMLFPRLLGLAEIGWAPAQPRAFKTFRTRLPRHGRRLAALDVNFYRTPLLDWD